MITYHTNVVQGSEEWHALRCGMLTASEMKHIITPKKLQFADNDVGRGHMHELLAQRVTKYVEPAYVSDDMLRGVQDEFDAKMLYSRKYAPVTDVGFVTNDEFGFTLGYSPDGLVGDDGLVEFKSRRQKYHVQTICDGRIPDEFLLQIQTGLLVTQRLFLDFGSYCGGLPMFIWRTYPDELVQEAIVEAALQFETRLADRLFHYNKAIIGLHPTERKEYGDILA